MTLKQFDAFTRLDASDVNAFLVNKPPANPVINGGFDIWQRGTTFTDAAFGYQADRWSAGRGGFTTGLTISRQAGTPLAGTQYAARVQRVSGNTSTADIRFGTTFESANSIPFAGQTVTLSFYARKGANFSPVGSLLTFFLRTGTGIDEGNIVPADNFPSGPATVITGTTEITTEWERHEFTGTIASTATQIGIRFAYSPTGTAGANDWFEITGVQVEIGAKATLFRRNGNSIQGELAACQRYYFRTPTGAFANLATGRAESATIIKFFIHQPVTFRTSPSSIDFGGTISISGTGAATLLFMDVANPNQTRIQATATGQTAGDSLFLFNGGGNAFIALEAELI